MHGSARYLLLATVALMGWLPSWLGGARAEPAASAAADVEQVSSPSRPPLRRIARGGAGTIISSGFLHDLEHNPELRGAKWHGEPGKLGIAGKMMRDPDVRALVYYAEDGLGGGKWRFKSPTDDPTDIEAAAFCTWAFCERLAFKELVKQMVRGFMPHGFSLHEMLDDQVALPSKRFPRHPGGGLGVVPVAFEERPAWTVWQWYANPKRTSQLDGIRQRLSPSDAGEPMHPFIHADRLVRLTFAQEGGDFTGLAPLRPVYGAWKLKNALETIDAIKHERTGVGTPTITLGEKASKEDIAAAEIVLAEMRANAKGFLVLPHGWVFEWEGASENDSSNLHLAIQRCKVTIAYGGVNGHMMLGLQGGGTAGGSYALAATQQGAGHLHLDSYAAAVCAAFTHGSDGWSPAERITRLNYGPDVSVPVLEARALPTRPWHELVKTAVAAKTAGLITADDRLEAEIREFLELGPHDPTTARKPQPVAAFGGQPAGDKPEPDDIDPDEDPEVDA